VSILLYSWSFPIGWYTGFKEAYSINQYVGVTKVLGIRECVLYIYEEQV